jgi:hypothetical protein
MLKPGDHVRMFDTKYQYYVYGEITIIRKEDNTAKVIWNGDTDLNYDYYPMNELQLITEEDTKDE